MSRRAVVLTASCVCAIANHPNALSPLIRSGAPPAEFMPAHRTFKYISNATASDEEQLTGHVIAAAVLLDADPTSQVWTRLQVFGLSCKSCDFGPATVQRRSLIVLSAGLAGVKWHAMHRAESCATCRVLAAPDVVACTFVMDVTRATSPRRTTEETGYLFKRSLAGTFVPARAR